MNTHLYPVANSSANNFTQSKYFYRLSTIISVQSLFGLDKYVYTQEHLLLFNMILHKCTTFLAFIVFISQIPNNTYYPKYSPTLAEINSMKANKYSPFLTNSILTRLYFIKTKLTCQKPLQVGPPQF